MPTVDRASRDGSSIWLAEVPCPRCRSLLWTDGEVCWCSDVRCDYRAIMAAKLPAKGTR